MQNLRGKLRRGKSETNLHQRLASTVQDCIANEAEKVMQEVSALVYIIAQV